MNTVNSRSVATFSWQSTINVKYPKIIFFSLYLCAHEVNQRPRPYQLPHAPELPLTHLPLNSLTSQNYLQIMAKAGFWLRGAQGKYAGAVLQNAAGGGTIMRENVTPSNPQTTSQVSQRTKFKLMSQLSAVLSPVIAIRRDGALSPRNVFQKLNFPLITEANSQAQLSYENIQLTKSNIAFPDVSVERDIDNGDITVFIGDQNHPLADNITRCVIVIYTKNSEGNLTYITSEIVEKGKLSALLVNIEPTLPVQQDVVVFAYGIIDSSDAATVKYDSMNVASGVDIVTLMNNRQLSASDFTFTRTRGATIFAGETKSLTAGPNQARVFVTATSGGTVTGGGVYDIGSSVTVVATPGVDASFVAWRNNDGSSTNLSTSASYTFTINSNQTIDLLAVFEEIGVTPTNP